MASKDDDLDLDVEGKKGSGGGKMKNIIIFSVIGILLVGISITTTLLLLGGKKDSGPAEKPKTEERKETKAAEEHKGAPEVTHGANVAYLDLTPPFVVNLDSQESDVRYLQVAVSVMVKKEADLEIVKKHMPMIRHNLVLLFSSLDFAEVRTTEGKIKLTERALKVIQDAMKKVVGAPVVEAVFLPSIVGQ